MNHFQAHKLTAGALVIDPDIVLPGGERKAVRVTKVWVNATRQIIKCQLAGHPGRWFDATLLEEPGAAPAPAKSAPGYSRASSAYVWYKVSPSGGAPFHVRARSRGEAKHLAGEMLKGLDGAPGPDFSLGSIAGEPQL